MYSWQAFLLGLIEGITEYLPVSSTGHLLVAQRLMGIGLGSPAAKEAADAFAVCIQGGAILAVLGLYWRRIVQMLYGVAGKNPQGRKLAINIVVGFLPAAVLGLLFSSWIKEYLFGMWPIVTTWIIGGIAILATAWWRKHRTDKDGSGLELSELTWKMALAIGFLQCIAMCPGVSRSLMTICGGLLVGLSIRGAVEYSFLLGLVTLGAATAKDAVDKADVEGFQTLFGGTKLMYHEYGAMPMAVGLVAATVSAALAVKWLVTYLQSHGLAVFGWYRIAIGVVVAGMLLGGVMEP